MVPSGRRLFVSGDGVTIVVESGCVEECRVTICAEKLPIL